MTDRTPLAERIAAAPISRGGLRGARLGVAAPAPHGADADA
nr:hypothetical protein [Janibacter limosus]